MTHRFLKNTLALSASLLWLAAPLRADDIAEKGRAILEKNKSAVVTIQIVMKGKWEMKGYNQPAQEMKQDITGVIIDNTGLAVTSLVGTDPGALYENYYAGNDGESKAKWQSELTDVKILATDGTEIPAAVVLRDKDLDLAFIRPVTKPDAPMSFIDLSAASEAQVLDQLITLNRLGKVSQRVYAAAVERIDAVVLKPKKFYIPGSEMSSTRMGCPAFALDGKVVGLFVVRMAKGRSGGGGGFSAADNYASIILPASDVLKAAQQAPAAAEKKEEKKEENKTDDKGEKK